MPVGTPHSFKNESSKPAKMLISVAPAGLEHMFFEIGVPLPEGSITALLPTKEEFDGARDIDPITVPHSSQRLHTPPVEVLLPIGNSCANRSRTRESPDQGFSVPRENHRDLRGLTAHSAFANLDALTPDCSSRPAVGMEVRKSCSAPNGRSRMNCTTPPTGGRSNHHFDFQSPLPPAAPF